VTPELSVVVPSVGRGTVGAAVASVLESARRCGAAVEVIVAWQSADAPELPAGVVVVPALAAGVSVARNAGLAAARAPLVGYVDDDEVAEPGWCAGILSAFADPQVQAAFGQVLPLDAEGLPYCEIRFDAPRIVRGRRRPPWEIGTGGNMAFRRAALLALGGFDVRLGQGTPSRSGEDTDAIARLQASGALIALRPDMVVRHPTKTPGEQLASRRPYGRGMGALTRRQGSPVLAAHFAVACFWALREIVRLGSRARTRELAQTVWGWLEGMLAPDRWQAPAAVPERAPAEVRAAIGTRVPRGEPVAPGGPLRLRYACGDDLVLHVRTGDPQARSRALAAQRRLDGQPGVPRVLAAADDGAAQWVLEERVRGEPPATGSWEAATAWLAGLAAAGGGRTRDGGWWAWAMEALPRWSAGVRDALEIVGDLPAGPALGDARPHNLRGGATDWAGAVPDAPVGFDLVTLALTSPDGRPHADALAALLAGREPPAGPLLSRLEALGGPRPAVPALALVTAAHQAEVEARRRAEPAGPLPPARFAALLARAPAFEGSVAPTAH
jgi:hypothetical protein